ncbi:flavodoxin family protein [Humidesulfovibrio sp.]
MRALLVYSSRTGNTRMLAQAICAALPEWAELHPVESAPSPEGFDFVALGFWVDKGRPDDKALEYMAKVQGQRVGFFGTMGASPESEHGHGVLQAARDALAGNEILCEHLCLGRIDPAITAAMSAHHPMTPERKARIDTASTHPDEADCLAATAVFAEALAKLSAGAGQGREDAA